LAADKTLTCRECSQSFVFPVREQEFFAGRGFPDPVRCLPCRRALKARRAGEAPPSVAPRPAMREPRPERETPPREEFPELHPAYRAESRRPEPALAAAGPPRGRPREDHDEDRPRRPRRRVEPPSGDDEE